MTSRELRAWIDNEVATRLLPVTEGAGFKLNRTRLAFVRARPSAVQAVTLGFDVPRAGSGEFLVLHPTIRVVLPAVAPTLAEPSDTIDTPSVLQPLSYPAEGNRPRQWGLSSPEDAPQVAASIASALSDRMPLLDALLDADWFGAAAADRDPRILWHRQAIASAIAITALKGDKMAAARLAQSVFLGKGLEREFPAVARLLE